VLHHPEAGHRQPPPQARSASAHLAEQLIEQPATGGSASALNTWSMEPDFAAFRTSSMAEIIRDHLVTCQGDAARERRPPAIQIAVPGRAGADAARGTGRPTPPGPLTPRSRPRGPADGDDDGSRSSSTPAPTSGHGFARNSLEHHRADNRIGAQRLVGWRGVAAAVAARRPLASRARRSAGVPRPRRRTWLGLGRRRALRPRHPPPPLHPPPPPPARAPPPWPRPSASGSHLGRPVRRACQRGLQPARELRQQALGVSSIIPPRPNRARRPVMW